MIGMNNPKLSRKAAWLINALRVQVILEKLDSDEVEKLVELILDSNVKTVDELQKFIKKQMSDEARKLIPEFFK